jgi:hypothetical protein
VGAASPWPWTWSYRRWSRGRPRFANPRARAVGCRRARRRSSWASSTASSAWDLPAGGRGAGAPAGQLPQTCLRHDRLSAYEGLELAFAEAMANESEHGLESLRSDAGAGASRAASQLRQGPLPPGPLWASTFVMAGAITLFT